MSAPADRDVPGALPGRPALGEPHVVERGYDSIFRKAGVTIVEPSCGACINAGPGASTRSDQIVISAQNRNFPGRSGPGQMYLASPLTVAASAVEGIIVPYNPAAVSA